MSKCPIYINSNLYSHIKRIAKELNISIENLANQILSAMVTQYDQRKLKEHASGPFWDDLGGNYE